MKKKEYRVICWQPSSSSLNDEIYADIVPAEGVIHDMIFYSRLQIFRGNQPNLMIRDVAKSIYLNVINEDEPEIVFAQETEVSHERLRQIILQTYKKMKEAGKNSTLPYVLSAPETEIYADQIKEQQQEKNKQQQKLLGREIKETDEEIFMRREREKRGIFARKHQSHLNYPQTPQEEQMMQNQENFIQSCKRRKIAQAMHEIIDAKTNPITRLKQKYLRDGD